MKQNFGLDGSSADFTIGKGKMVQEYKISFVFIAQKRPNSRFLELWKSGWSTLNWGHHLMIFF